MAQNIPVPPAAIEPASPHKCPTRTPGLAGTNTAFLVPDHIQKKFIDGWNIHVPLTFLTDKGCLLKNRPAIAASQDILSVDSDGRILTTPKPLSDDGELDLTVTFNERHQAWHHLLEFIKTFLPEELQLWETHYSYILNNQNRAELWPNYVAYDVEIRRRVTQSPIDPSVFSIAIWNDLEARLLTKKVVTLVKSDLELSLDLGLIQNSISNQGQSSPRKPNQGSSFWDQSSDTSSKTGRCIFCGDRTKSHLSRNCSAACNTNSSPCHLHRAESSGTREQIRKKILFHMEWTFRL